MNLQDNLFIKDLYIHRVIKAFQFCIYLQIYYFVLYTMDFVINKQLILISESEAPVLYIINKGKKSKQNNT